MEPRGVLSAAGTDGEGIVGWPSPGTGTKRTADPGGPVRRGKTPLIM